MRALLNVGSPTGDRFAVPLQVCRGLLSCLLHRQDSKDAGSYAASVWGFNDQSSGSSAIFCPVCTGKDLDRQGELRS